MRYARIYPWRRTRRSRAPSNGPDAFFVAQFSAGYTTNMFGFDLRQGQATYGHFTQIRTTSAASATALSSAATPEKTCRIVSGFRSAPVGGTRCRNTSTRRDATKRRGSDGLAFLDRLEDLVVGYREHTVMKAAQNLIAAALVCALVCTTAQAQQPSAAPISRASA